MRVQCYCCLAIVAALLFSPISTAHAASLETTFPVPTGFHRVAVDSGSFTHYLRQLQILPASEPVRRYDSSPVTGWPATVRVLDLPFLFHSNLEQCADVGYRLFCDYARSIAADSLLFFHLQNGQLLSWTRWRQGDRLRFSQETGTHVPLQARPDSSEQAYRDFLHYLFQWSGSAALKDFLAPISEDQLQPGDLIVQNTTGGIGHVTILLDKCVSDSGKTLFLFANGWTPAQTPFVWKVGEESGTGYWATLDDYRQFLAPFGFGPFNLRSFRAW